MRGGRGIVIAVVVGVVAAVYFYSEMSIYRNAVWFVKGYREYMKSGYEAAAKNFNPQDLEVDCSQRSFIVTGANSGLGYETALEIAKRQGVVHMVCRNEVLGKKAREELMQKTNNTNVHLHIVDMSKPKDIKAFTSSFTKEHESLNVLINNAGSLLNERKTTGEGLDANFATNTLGYYLMTKGLLELLSKSPDSRVIFVSSGGMLTQKLDYEDFNFQKMAKYDGVTVYAQNKRQQIVMCEQFAKEWNNKVHFSSMHPGWSDTPGVQTSLPEFYNKFKNQLRTSSQGADTLIWLAVSPTVPSIASGSFFQDRLPVPTHLPLAWTRTSVSEDVEFMNRLEKLANDVTA